MLIGEVATWCPSSANRPDTTSIDLDHANCTYILRNAFMEPFSPGHGGVVEQFARQSFVPQVAVGALKEANISPDQLRTMHVSQLPPDIFTSLADPMQVIGDNVTARTISSADCPALAREINTLERRQISLALDLSSVGQDIEQTQYLIEAGRKDTLTIMTSGGVMELSGYDFTMEPYVGPILGAADECIARQSNTN